LDTDSEEQRVGLDVLLFPGHVAEAQVGEAPFGFGRLTKHVLVFGGACDVRHLVDDVAVAAAG
jgi:hypothetical protein